MTKYLLKLMIAVLLVITACSTGGVNVIETKQETVSYEEKIRINNCGGKSESEQTASRSFGTSIEFGAEASVGVKQIVEGSVSAKYGEYRTASKSQRLTAPPGANMEFVLLWQEDVRVGNVEADGEAGTFEVRIPLSVEQTSSQDLGCAFGTGEGTLLVEDGFDDNNNIWNLNVDRVNNYMFSTSVVKDGVLRWQATAKQGFTSAICPNSVNAVENSYTSIMTRQKEGVPNGASGLRIRDNSNGYYIFHITPNEQKYHFLLRNNLTDEWVLLLSGTSAAINTGGWNEIEVLQRESDFTFWINNTEVGKTNNNTFLWGFTCVSIELNTAGDSAVWEFDNLLIRVP